MSFTPIETGLEDVFEELFTKRTLAFAEGEQLDVYGRHVGVLRQGLLDGPYRIRIKAQIRINLSEGTPEEILQIARALLPTTVDFRIIEYYPAAFEVIVDGEFTDPDDEVATALCRAKPAGVRCLMRTHPDNPFEFFGGSDGSGFGDEGDPNVGGNFASVSGG